MKGNAMRVVGVLGIVVASAVYALQPVEVVAVTSAEAAAVLGGLGNCDGDTWASGKVNCDAGTVLCSGGSENCGDVQLDSLVSTGDGNEVEKTGENKSCLVCGARLCSTGHVVKSTKSCKKN